MLDQEIAWAKARIAALETLVETLIQHIEGRFGVTIARQVAANGDPSTDASAAAFSAPPALLSVDEADPIASPTNAGEDAAASPPTETQPEN